MDGGAVVSIKGNDMETQAMADEAHGFDRTEREALYKTIFTRRDVRGQFLDREIPEDVLSRILLASHYAPSVGFMQPWNFVLVRGQEVKAKVHGLFRKAHDEAAEMFEGARKDTYRNLKLEGIMESPVNICVTCDKDRAGPVVLGRTHQPEMDLYSSVCAVQNMWLAARSEGVGFGWVSILRHEELAEVLGLPENVTPVAYICLGYVSHFHEKPELQKTGWRKRLPVGELVNFDGFGAGADDDYARRLIRRLGEDQARLEDSGYDGRFVPG